MPARCLRVPACQRWLFGLRRGIAVPCMNACVCAWTLFFFFVWTGFQICLSIYLITSLHQPSSHPQPQMRPVESDVMIARPHDQDGKEAASSRRDACATGLTVERTKKRRNCQSTGGASMQLEEEELARAIRERRRACMCVCAMSLNSPSHAGWVGDGLENRRACGCG